jgi:hypothetical protein
MSGPGFAPPGLCSIRGAAAQEELAEAVRGGFSANRHLPAGDDPPAPPFVTVVRHPLSHVDRTPLPAVALMVFKVISGLSSATAPTWTSRGPLVRDPRSSRVCPVKPEGGA